MNGGRALRSWTGSRGGRAPSVRATACTAFASSTSPTMVTSSGALVITGFSMRSKSAERSVISRSFDGRPKGPPGATASAMPSDMTMDGEVR